MAEINKANKSLRDSFENSLKKFENKDSNTRVKSQHGKEQSIDKTWNYVSEFYNFINEDPNHSKWDKDKNE